MLSTRRARSASRWVALALVAGLAVGGAACSDDDDGDEARSTTTTRASTTTTRPTTTSSSTTSTTEAPTTTEAAGPTTEAPAPTTAAPPGPQPTTTTIITGGAPSPEAAARTMYEAWKAGDRRKAGTVASASAVDRLFREDRTDSSSFGGSCSLDGETHACSVIYQNGDFVLRVQGQPAGGYKVIEVTFFE